jgi:hypothetical protein
MCPNCSFRSERKRKKQCVQTAVSAECDSRSVVPSMRTTNCERSQIEFGTETWADAWHRMSVSNVLHVVL